MISDSIPQCDLELKLLIISDGESWMSQAHVTHDNYSKSKNKQTNKK